MVSNIFYFHPYLGKISILTNIFQRGWNHQPAQYHGLARLLEQQDLPRAMEALLQVVQYAGQQRRVSMAGVFFGFWWKEDGCFFFGNAAFSEGYFWYILDVNIYVTIVYKF